VGSDAHTFPGVKFPSQCGSVWRLLDGFVQGESCAVKADVFLLDEVIRLSLDSRPHSFSAAPVDFGAVPIELPFMRRF
jgi:hypothetical protein